MRLERLLEYLDQPDVAEVVVGLDRPPAIRIGNSYRPVTQQPFMRDEINTLFAGTALDGLLDAGESLPPLDLEVATRKLVVEVIVRGAEIAVRIALRTPTRNERDSRVSFKAGGGGSPTSAPPNRPATSPPASTVTRTPPSGLPIQNTTRIPTTTRTPAMGVPIAAAQPRAATTPPTGVPAATATTSGPGGGPTPAATAGTSRIAITPMTVAPRNAAATDIPTSRVPLVRPGDTPSTIPVANKPAPMPSPIEGMAIVDGTEIEVLLAPPEQWTGPRIIDERANVAALVPLIRAARTAKGTDLHLAAGRTIMIRRVGELVPLDVDSLPSPVSPGLRAALSGVLAPSTAQGLLWPLLGPSAQKQLGSVGYVDLAVDVPGGGRVRINISRQQEGLSGTFRLITPTTPTLDSLGLPKELAKVIGHHQGLVVLAGPNGHGKTTTMAALVDQLNSTKKHHIITIEEPVEVEHDPKMAIVSHREVLRHTLSFVNALKASLREDPDVIVIGELRDAETVEIALTAAETGHLVLATMSTPSAAKTIDRLIDMFPPDDQPQVRASISGTLRAVIAQRLLPSADHSQLVAAVELVTGVLPLASMIRDNKLYQLPNLMQRGRAFGMIRLDDSLIELVRQKKITEQVAIGASDNKKEITAQLQPRPAPGTSPPNQTQSKGLFGRKGRE